MRSINLIVIHCSASPNGVFIAPERVDAWHRERGFKRTPAAVAKFNSKLPHIGYHWLIGTDGRLYPGRHTDEVGAHVAGSNTGSVGICLVGTDKFFAAQFAALTELLCTLAQTWQHELLAKPEQVAYSTRPAAALALFAKMKIRITGHRDLSPDKNGDGKITPNEWLKTCPGFPVAELLVNELKASAAWLLDRHDSVASASPLTRVAAA